MDIGKLKNIISRLNVDKPEDLDKFIELRDLYFNKLSTKDFYIFNNKYLEFELENSLKDILSNNLELKIKASKYLEKVPRKETNLKDCAWLKDPRTISILVEALNDSNEIVIGNISLALGNIVKRYKYIDNTIFKKIIENYNKVDVDTKIQIAQSIAVFSTSEKWQYLYDALSIAKKTKQREILARVTSWDIENMPKEYKAKFLILFETILKVEKNENTIYEIERNLSKYR